MKKLVALFSSLLLAGLAFANPAKVSDISQPELQAAIASKSAVIIDVNGYFVKAPT